jgi:hypothetical protein
MEKESRFGRDAVYTSDKQDMEIWAPYESEAEVFCFDVDVHWQGCAMCQSR